MPQFRVLALSLSLLPLHLKRFPFFFSINPQAADLAALASLATPDLPFTLELLPSSARAASALVAPGPAPAHAQASTKHFFTAPRIKALVIAWECDCRG